MPISIPTVREKSVTVNSSPTLLAAANPVEVDSTDSIFLGIVAASPIDPPNFTVTNCATSQASITVTSTSSFANVKVGDAVTGTGIASNTTVTEKVNDSLIRLSAPAEASGVVTLTFNPPAITPTYYGIEIQHSYSRDRFNLSSIILHKYDGSLGGVVGTTQNSIQKINLVPAPSSPAGALEVNIEDFQTKLRVPRQP